MPPQESLAMGSAMPPTLRVRQRRSRTSRHELVGRLRDQLCAWPRRTARYEQCRSAGGPWQREHSQRLFASSSSTIRRFIAEVGALAMGSGTYAWMLRHADTVAADLGAAWPYTQPAWIFSHRKLPTIPGATISFVQGDVQPVYTAMRQAAGDKNLWIVGGGDLAGQFHDAGLLDEIIVQIGSVTLGTGRPLFPRRLTQPPLRLVSVQQIGTSFAELRYAVMR